MTPIQKRIDDLRVRIDEIDGEQYINEQNDEWDDDLQCKRAELEWELAALEGNEYEFKVPSLEDCEKALGEPAERWVSRCHEIACALLDKLGLAGKSQYGFYYGPIVEGSHFHPQPLARHGWVLLADGRIFDPTRWCFDSPDEPYIFCLHPDWIDDEYDFGMNRYKAANLKPPPSVGDFADGDPRREKEERLPLDGQARDFVRQLFDDIPWQPNSVDEGVIVLTNAQCFWLANYPHHMLGAFAKPVYEALRDADLLEFIPLDNREAEGVEKLEGISEKT